MSSMTCEVQELRNIVTLKKGKPPSQQPYFGQDAELYLTPEYLRGRGSVEPVKPSLNAVRVVEGDTIVLWDGSNAGEFFRARKGILASTMSRIRHDNIFDKEYFFYAVKNWESYLKGQTSGSGIPHVDKEVLGKLEIFQFSKPEQTKIAEILSNVDQAIEQTEALIAKQQRIKTGLMQDLLTRGIDEHGNLRSEQTHEFKESPLGRIPVEWEVKTLREVARGGAQNGFFKKPELVGFGYKLINVSEIYQPFSIDTNHEEVERVEATPNDLSKYGVNEGDLFFTRSSLVLEGIAHCNVIRTINEPTLFECHVIRIRPDKEIVAPEFLALFCQSNVARLYLMSRAKHVTMTTISQPELEALSVPVPPTLEEQMTIVSTSLKNLNDSFI